MSAAHLRPMRRALAGFTLVEALVGITLLALIVTILYGGVRLALRVWDVAQTQARQDNGELALEFLRRALEQARPALRRDRDGSMQLAFVGTRERVRFVGGLPDAVGRPGDYWQEIGFEHAHEAGRLTLRFRDFVPHQDDRAGDGRWTRAVLMEEAQSARFRYFGRTVADEPLAWRDEWTAAAELPLLIEIAIAGAQSPAIATLAAPRAGRYVLRDEAGMYAGRAPAR